jgi:hypothetical protein
MNLVIEYVTGLSMVAGHRGAAPPSSPVPVHMAIDAKGLASFRPGSGADTSLLSADDWDVMDREVQDRLSGLTADVLRQEPRAIWKAGRTAARAFPLFTYRVFYHLDGNDYDPIVVGVTFTVPGPVVWVTGDISGDETGVVYFDEGCTLEVPAEPLAVQEAARTVADRLASRESIVLDAIRNRHPRAVPR